MFIYPIKSIKLKSWQELTDIWYFLRVILNIDLKKIKGFISSYCSKNCLSLTKVLKVINAYYNKQIMHRFIETANLYVDHLNLWNIFRKKDINKKYIKHISYCSHRSGQTLRVKSRKCFLVHTYYSRQFALFSPQIVLRLFLPFLRPIVHNYIRGHFCYLRTNASIYTQQRWLIEI